MIRSALFAAVTALGASAPLVAQTVAIPPGATVAYVSGQRLTAETVEGRAGQAKLQTFQQQKAAELRTRQQALEDTRQKVVVAGDPADRAKLQQQESVQRSDLERATAQANADVQAMQREVAREFQLRVRAALDEIVKGSSIEVVLQLETGVLWATPRLDLTSAVIERLNKPGPDTR